MLKKLVSGLALYMVVYGGATLGGFGGMTNVVSQDKPMAIPAAKKGADPQAPRRMGENLIAYASQDEAMQAARRQARDSLGRFTQMWGDGQPGTYTIKFPLTQNGATEHIWLQVDQVSTDGFTGRLANEPVNGTKYKMGQSMDIAKSDVEDWMVRDGDAIWGAYSLRVMLGAMPKEEASKYMAMLRD